MRREEEAQSRLRSQRTGERNEKESHVPRLLQTNKFFSKQQKYCNLDCSICTGRNRRATATLSPVLIHFLSPSSFLSQKLQLALTQLRANSNIPLPLATKRRPGPAKPKHGIPPTEWPTVQRRVLENQEPLRKVADDYGVSYETVRRTVLAARKAERA